MAVPRAGDILFDLGGAALLRYGSPHLQRQRWSKEAGMTITRNGLKCLQGPTGQYRDARIDTAGIEWLDLDGDGTPEPYLVSEGAGTQLIETAEVALDAVGWQTNVAAAARDQTNVLHGTWAMKVTTTNVGGSGHYNLTRAATKIVAAAAVPYTVTQRIYAPAASVGKAMQVRIEWYDAGSVLLSTSSANVTLLAGWNAYGLTATSPANTAFAIPTFYTNGVQGVFDYWASLPQLENWGYAHAPYPTQWGSFTWAEDVVSVPVGFQPPAVGAEYTFYFRGDARWPRTGGSGGNAAGASHWPGIFVIGGTGSYLSDGKVACDLYREAATANYAARIDDGAGGSQTVNVGLPATGFLEVIFQLRASGASHFGYLERADGTNASTAARAMAGKQWRDNSVRIGTRGNGHDPGALLCGRLFGARGRYTMAEMRAY